MNFHLLNLIFVLYREDIKRLRYISKIFDTVYTKTKHTECVICFGFGLMHCGFIHVLYGYSVDAGANDVGGYVGIVKEQSFPLTGDITNKQI